MGKKILRGAVWLSAAQLFARGIRTIRVLVLAYLLSPEDIGRFGIAAVIMQLVQVLSHTGLRQALIQRAGIVSHQLGTVWISQMLRGLIVGGLIYGLAPACERFFDKPGVAELLQVLCIVPLIAGIQNVGIVHLERELRFSKIIVLTLATAVVDFVVTCGVAMIYPSPWALVAGLLTGTMFTTLASFMIERRWASWSFSWADFRSLYSFGFWIFVSSVASFILVRGGDFVVGKLLTLGDLGVYQVAYALACAPIMEVAHVIGRATFPALSQIQHDLPRLQQAFLRIFTAIGTAAFLWITSAFLISEDFTLAILDPRYRGAASILPLLAVWGACRALGASNSVLFQAVGKPALAVVFQVLMIAIFAAIIYPLTIEYGSWGVALSLVITGLSAQMLRYLLLIQVLKVRPSEIGKRLLAPLIVALAVFLTAGAAHRLLLPAPPSLRLAITFSVIVAVSIPATLAADRYAGFGMSHYVSLLFVGRSQVTHSRP